MLNVGICGERTKWTESVPHLGTYGNPEGYLPVGYIFQSAEVRRSEHSFLLREVI